MTLREPNVLDKLGSLIPGYLGHADRELRRTSDQRLRHALAQVLDECKSALYPVIDQLVSAGRLDAIGQVHGLQRQLGTCADTIRYAQAGGSGLMDATKVGAAELDRAHAHDLELHERATSLAAAVRAVTLATLEPSLAAARARADELLSAIRQRDAIFQEVFQCPS